MIEAKVEELNRVLARWDETLAALGGDPSREDWEAFRPLRLSHEGDWSDWLVYLLGRCRSGLFAATLFDARSPDADAWRIRSWDREREAEIKGRCRRADIVLHFRDGAWLPIEVKIGDQEFAKTPETVAALEAALSPAPRRASYVVLPEESVPEWIEQCGEDCGTNILTWKDVAAALRRTMVDPAREDISWRVWARAFVGAIEQRILGYSSTAKCWNARANVVEHVAYLRSSEAS